MATMLGNKQQASQWPITKDISFLTLRSAVSWVALNQAIAGIWSIPQVFILRSRLKGQWYKERVLPMTDLRILRRKAKPHEKNKKFLIIKEAKISSRFIPEHQRS